MRIVLATLLAIGLAPACALAQDDLELPTEPGDEELEGPAVLSSDPRAHLSLGGFRGYLERLREDDDALYGILDPRLDALEERNTIADVIFWTGTALAVGALVSAIPVHEELGLDASLAFIFAGVGTFALAAIVQAIVRPGQSDLMALIDLHDQRLGRR